MDKVYFNELFVMLGIYDGVYFGYQLIICKMVKEVYLVGKEFVLFIFYLYFCMVFYLDSYLVWLIDMVDEKLEKLRKFGLDIVIFYFFILWFLWFLVVEFVWDVLVIKLNILYMLVGYDYYFGKNWEGDFYQLVELGMLYGFMVE